MLLNRQQTKPKAAVNKNLYKLASVKECLHHPQLPTFRKMDIDTAAHKLPNQHCRTTANCSRETFNNATITLYRPPRRPLTCTNVTETGRILTDQYRRNPSPFPHDGPLHKTGNEILQKTESRLPFSGYSMRYLSPSVTTSWKHSLIQTSSMDDCRQRPIHTNILTPQRHAFLTARVKLPAWRC